MADAGRPGGFCRVWRARGLPGGRRSAHASNRGVCTCAADARVADGNTDAHACGAYAYRDAAADAGAHAHVYARTVSDTTATHADARPPARRAATLLRHRLAARTLTVAAKRVFGPHPSS